MSDNISFTPPGTASDLEEGLALTPKFDADGLVTCVATDAGSGEVLMVAHMNAEALARTIATGEAWYFSRSRGTLWKKGETSGHAQRVVEMRVDCDQDAILIKVEQSGGACHTGRRSCFYRAVPLGKPGAVTLEFREERVFDPKSVYKNTLKTTLRGKRLRSAEARPIRKSPEMARTATASPPHTQTPRSLTLHVPSRRPTRRARPLRTQERCRLLDRDARVPRASRETSASNGAAV